MGRSTLSSRLARDAKRPLPGSVSVTCLCTACQCCGGSHGRPHPLPGSPLLASFTRRGSCRSLNELLRATKRNLHRQPSPSESWRCGAASWAFWLWGLVHGN